MQTVLDYILPILAVLATVFIPIAGAAVVKLFQKFGIEIAAKDREALQSALANAVALALAGKKDTLRSDASQAQGFLGLGNPLMSIALSYVLRSVPDAVKRFGLNEAAIIDLLKPHFARAMEKKEG